MRGRNRQANSYDEILRLEHDTIIFAIRESCNHLILFSNIMNRANQKARSRHPQWITITFDGRPGRAVGQVTI
jgi:hypothetical protein